MNKVKYAKDYTKIIRKKLQERNPNAHKLTTKDVEAIIRYDFNLLANVIKNGYDIIVDYKFGLFTDKSNKSIQKLYPVKYKKIKKKKPISCV